MQNENVLFVNSLRCEICQNHYVQLALILKCNKKKNDSLKVRRSLLFYFFF